MSVFWPPAEISKSLLCEKLLFAALAALQYLQFHKLFSPQQVGARERKKNVSFLSVHTKLAVSSFGAGHLAEDLPQIVNFLISEFSLCKNICKEFLEMIFSVVYKYLKCFLQGMTDAMKHVDFDLVEMR